MAAKYSIMANFLTYYLIYDETLCRQGYICICHVSLLYFAKLLSQELVPTYTLIHRVGTDTCPPTSSPDLQYSPGFQSANFVRVKQYLIAPIWVSFLFFFHISEDEHLKMFINHLYHFMISLFIKDQGIPLTLHA